MAWGKKIAIVSAVRTPIGKIGGALSTLSVCELGVLAVKGALDVSKIDPGLIEYTSGGWVLQDPRYPNLAKTVAEKAGISSLVPGTTVHENCASGAAAIHDICRRILVGDITAGVAFGAESMSNVPRYLFQGRTKGSLYGDFALEDGIMGALKDREVGSSGGELMGFMTERLVQKYRVTREAQDQVAFKSHENARKSWDEGYFSDDYILKVSIADRKKTTVVDRDEGPRDVSLAQLADQKPYFKADGTITGMNSSSINDGAAALVLMDDDYRKRLGIPALGYILGYHNIGVPREYMGEGAFLALEPLFEKTGRMAQDVDYFEMNEAFAAVVAAAFNHYDWLNPDRVNCWGSGISLGHPVGCTGARQVVDMVHQLRKRKRSLGVTSRCVGGGMGSAELIEVV